MSDAGSMNQVSENIGELRGLLTSLAKTVDGGFAEIKAELGDVKKDVRELGEGQVMFKGKLHGMEVVISDIKGDQETINTELESLTKIKDMASGAKWSAWLIWAGILGLSGVVLTAIKLLGK